MSLQIKLDQGLLDDLVWLRPHISKLPNHFEMEIRYEFNAYKFRLRKIYIAIYMIKPSLYHFQVLINGIYGSVFHEISPPCEKINDLSLYYRENDTILGLFRCLWEMENDFNRKIDKYSADHPIRNYPLFRLMEAHKISNNNASTNKDYTILDAQTNIRILYKKNVIVENSGHLDYYIEMMLDGTAPKEFYFGYNPISLKSARSSSP